MDTNPRTVTFAAGNVELTGDLTIPDEPHGIVLFAHGSGSSRHSSRNKFVATELNRAGLATFLFDLLTEAEEIVDNRTGQHRFDIELLAERLVGACRWIAANDATTDLPLGIFGASTGGAAALFAAARLPEKVHAVVSRGGRPDLAADALPLVKAPTLLIVGSLDDIVI